MLKYKAGLHKEVSTIFNGVSLPKNDIAQQSPAAPAPGHQDNSAPKLSAPEPSAQKPLAPVPPAQKPSAPEPPAQKPLAPSHMTPNKPKPQSPPPQPPKETPAKQPKADTAIKAAGQIPWRRTLEQIKNKLFATKPGVSTTTTKQKIMVILAPVLFVVLIFVFIRAFSTPSLKITGSGTSGPGMVAVAGPDGKVNWQVPNPYPATLRDPMQFNSAKSQTGTGELIVKGIIYSKDNPSAVIDDQIVHQGDKILDVVITKINKNSVEFEANSKKWTQNVQR